MSYKQTKVWTVDISQKHIAQSAAIKEAALWIREGKTVAFPTETVYGLGANALSEVAVANIFMAKGRPSDNPLIVHIGDKKQLTNLVTKVPSHATQLMEAFWPGALTLILHSKEIVAKNVSAGLNTIAVRMPDHPVALALLQTSDVPVAAPSANLSGRPSPTNAAHVLADLSGAIDGIVDAGITGIGVESTVLDVTGTQPVLYRPGGVSREEIEAVVGKIDVDPSLKGQVVVPKSPGMKYTHYAPKAKVVLVDEASVLKCEVKAARARGERVGIFATRGEIDYEADVIIKGKSLAHVAQMLYASLRRFDEENVTVIYVETVPEIGIGLAIMNRLEKAAGGRMILKK
ncbi:L-threonylcarbamoyladenylate synthase [Bacillus sp. FSL W7-1360]